MFPEAFVRVCLILLFCYNQAWSIMVTPCKVQNLITQPTHGTSLTTKALVNILQVPPVFVQNVMVGICETKNRNVSTGRMGEFFTCQQRYSAVEVYVEEAHALGGDLNQQRVQPSIENLNSLKFVRESVIIESGCDFTFNLLPFVTNTQNQPTQGAPSQQRMFLRSPYHNSIPTRQPPPPQADPSLAHPNPKNDLLHARAEGDEIVFDISPNDESEVESEN